MKHQLAHVVSNALENMYTEQEILDLLEVPKHEHLGDYAFPCFTLAKKLKKSPQSIAQQLAPHIQADFIKEVRVENAYINVFLNQFHIAQSTIAQILAQKEQYGSKPVNQKKIVLDYSSPNIAKPFSMGHLRSTVIGNALANIAEKMGYEAVRVNHLGDWGTQFGKLIVAYKLWGDEQRIKANPIEELLSIYVKFHEEAEHDEQLNEQARAAFKQLENQDAEAIALWKWFREDSLKEFLQIYDMLGVTFDSYHGEAFYNDKMNIVVEKLQAMNLLESSEGAMVVPLDEMPPCLITKTDGATLYATRDLAAAMYRYNTYNPAKILYVVGNEQSLHFKQLFAVLEKMGYPWHKNLHHVAFGMMLKDGKKMSTRKGKVVLLKEVLQETIAAVLKNIEDKNPNLTNKEDIASKVGIGAVIFNDLKNYRMNDIEFSIEQMVTFEGETGPYLQYTNARIHSILKKGVFVSGQEEKSISYVDEEAWSIIKQLANFPEVVEEGFLQADPSIIAKYALQLARSFNKYYASIKILSEDDKQEDRLRLAASVSIVLEEALKMLGISCPQEM